jgi:hypothetical protein
MGGGLGWVDRGIPKRADGEARSGSLSAVPKGLVRRKIGVAIGLGIEGRVMGIRHEKPLRCWHNSVVEFKRSMRARCQSEQGSIPIPTPTPILTMI